MKRNRQYEDSMKTMAISLVGIVLIIAIGLAINLIK